MPINNKFRTQFKSENPQILDEKNFDRTKKIMAQTKDVRDKQIKGRSLYKFNKKKNKLNKSAKLEDLMKELSYTNMELAQQKTLLGDIEKSYFTAENINL